MSAPELLDVVLVDRSSGSDVLIDLTKPVPRYDGNGTTLMRPSWTKNKSNTLLGKWPLLEVPDIYAAIQPGMEIWSGKRDGFGIWSDVGFCGYVSHAGRKHQASATARSIWTLTIFSSIRRRSIAGR
jgi:hypothetical protein